MTKRIENVLLLLVGSQNLEALKMDLLRPSIMMDRAEDDPQVMSMADLALLKGDLIRIGAAMAVASMRAREVARLAETIQRQLGPSGHVMFAKTGDDGAFVEAHAPDTPRPTLRVVH